LRSIARQGTAPVGALLLQYSLPAVAGFLTSALYQFVDRILVGRGVGTEAMAAVTCAYPMTMLAMGVGLLLGTGTGNQISTLLGQGRTEDAERVLGQSLRLAAQLGGGLALGLVVLARPLLRACGAEGHVLELAVPFLRIVSVGQVFLVAIISMGNILRVQGRPGLGLAFMAGGNVLNAGLAAWAIFGLHLGIAGAGAATAVSVTLNFLALLAFVQSRHSHLHVRRRHLAPDPALARSIVRLGAPILLMQVLGSVVFLAANHGAAAVDGARAVAAVGVFQTVSLLLIYPLVGVAQAMQPLVAFNRGAGRPDRVRALLGRTLAATTCLGVLSALAVWLFPGAVAALFTRSDTRLVEIVTEGLPWVMGSVAVFGLAGTASHYYLAVHQARAAGLLLLGRQLLAIPLFLALPRLLGLRGIYLVAILSDVPFAAVAAWLLRREWRRLDAAIGASQPGAAPEAAEAADAALSRPTG
jgi:putative MATE family efflux protein